MLFWGLVIAGVAMIFVIFGLAIHSVDNPTMWSSTSFRNLEANSRGRAAQAAEWEENNG